MTKASLSLRKKMWTKNHQAKPALNQTKAHNNNNKKHKKCHTKQRERQLPVYKHAFLFLSHPARSIHLWNHTRLQNTIPHQNEKDTVDRSAESGK